MPLHVVHLRPINKIKNERVLLHATVKDSQWPLGAFLPPVVQQVLHAGKLFFSRDRRDDLLAIPLGVNKMSLI